MMTTDSATRWRDERLVPSNYDDIATLVKLARKTRGRIVEFDWMFTRDDLLRLRRAVHERGSHVVGQYKCFDARVLAAINEALGDSGTALVLNEPRNSGWVDCGVSCAAEGLFFRLRGHAPFDIVFGYGIAGVEPNTVAAEHLGPTAQETLASAVGMLGWDLHRLHDERFRPVRNALYGNALGFGIPAPELPAGPAVDIPVHFHGPFSALDDDGCRYLFTDEIASRGGVYLWTIHVDGQDRPWYVGQTRRGFGERLSEHVRGFLSGEYQIYDAEALLRGENRLAEGAVSGIWPQTLPGFLRSYEKLAPKIAVLLRNMTFYLAPLDGDAHLLDRVEGAIGRHYKRHADSELRNFIFPGLRVPAAIPFDTRIRLAVERCTARGAATRLARLSGTRSAARP